ncbi:unnamed protein product [Polarella glacialis]|uniref:PNPLA domain-containing protein n=1 Tax=Polarella glacialis TaxID=89957 RepID=A0A813L7H7_POLGL|nr:unnamed protein product [Polarella glacialis]
MSQVNGNYRRSTSALPQNIRSTSDLHSNGGSAVTETVVGARCLSPVSEFVFGKPTPEPSCARHAFYFPARSNMPPSRPRAAEEGVPPREAEVLPEETTPGQQQQRPTTTTTTTTSTPASAAGHTSRAQRGGFAAEIATELTRRASRAGFEVRKETLTLYRELRRPREGEPVSSEAVFASEQDFSERRSEWLRSHGLGEPRPYSVALSGGGIRAAAFQCGVLWRLAACGRLKDLEHLSVVSGGSYVGTAFLTFLQASLSGLPADAFQMPTTTTTTPATTTAEVDSLYLQVMWRLVQRMQSNAGFLVRFSRDPFHRKGARPPVQGLLAFGSVLLLAFVVLPVVNFLLVGIPMAFLVDVTTGAAMRLAWCSDDRILLWYWTLRRCLDVILLLSFTAVLEVVTKLLRRRQEESSQGHNRTLLALIALKNLVFRAGVIPAVLVLLAWGSLGLQWLDHQGQAQPRCHSVSGLVSEPARCVDDLNGTPWYWQAGTSIAPGRISAEPHQLQWLTSVPAWLAFNGFVAVLAILGSCLKWRLLVIRGNHLIALLSPMWAAFVACLLTKWRIFGPLGERPDLFEERWDLAMGVLLGLAVVVLPFYGQLRQLVHIFYRRSLRGAFYHDGADVALSELQDVMFCPNIIVAATLVDYCRPADLDAALHYSEFFFTQRWMGGTRTGFIEVPKKLGLSRVMAMSGAATDAFLLTKMDAIWVRATILALFNLFMGDYVEFRSNYTQAKWKGRLQALLVNLMLVTFYVLLFLADRWSDSSMSCTTFHAMFWTGWGISAAVLAASFFAVFPCFHWLLSSTVIRHLHMAMMHYHTSDHPPLRLFLNDGGLVECLGLISLLRRRCEFMLVTDATADFSMQLVCLRESIRLAEDEQICTFFDQQDPRKGVGPLLLEFAASKASHVRIGVLYDCWAGDGARLPEARKAGEIFFIRMRLLDEGCYANGRRITEDEVMQAATTRTRTTGGTSSTSLSSAAAEQTPRLPSLLREDVGGCCCDCCHTSCNCGLVGRFPDISTGNQFLTPTQFALLCRLGFELSGEAVASMTVSQHQSHSETGGSSLQTAQQSAEAVAAAAVAAARSQLMLLLQPSDSSSVPAPPLSPVPVSSSVRL